MSIYGEFIEGLKDLISRLIDRKIKEVGCVLGTITDSGGVMLDGYSFEIKDPLFLEWDFVFTVGANKIKGNIGSGLMAGNLPVQGVFNFPTTTIKINEVKGEVKEKYKKGDRVLCIPVNSGKDIVVIGRVVNK